MIPVGYMAKRVYKRPDWLTAAQVTDIYSVSGCISETFADYINYWRHSGYWFFDSLEIIKGIANEHSFQLDGTSLFYYEAHEMEFDGDNWHPFAPEASFPTNVVPPSRKQLEGFDVVTFFVKTSPECSPLSCNSLANDLPTNSHCLLASFDEAEAALNNGAFANSEPGPYRIFAVYSVDWEHPSSSGARHDEGLRVIRPHDEKPTTAFSLPVLTERPHPTRLFLKKSRTSLTCPVQSRSENALIIPNLLKLLAIGSTRILCGTNLSVGRRRSTAQRNTVT